MFAATFIGVAGTTPSHWYNSGWLVGVATSLLAGLILALLGPALLRQKRTRDLDVRRDQVAEDWLQSVRSSVANGVLPSPELLEAVLQGSAYRRGLDASYAPSPSTLLKVLVKEVMESPFLAADRKKQLSGELVTLERDFAALSQPLAMRVDSDGSGYSIRREIVPAAALGGLVIGSGVALSIQLHTVIPWIASLAMVLFALFAIITGSGRIQHIRFGSFTIKSTGTIASGTDVAKVAEDVRWRVPLPVDPNPNASTK